MSFVSHIRKRWWFALALFFTLFWATPFVGGIIRNTDFTLLERLQTSVGMLGLLALWGLALQRRIFQRLFWRCFFFVDVLVLTSAVIFGTKYDFPLLWCVIIWLTSAILSILYYGAMFIYAFRSSHIWKPRGDEADPASARFSHYRRKLTKTKWSRFLRLSSILTLVILCLTFVPAIIRNNRVIYTPYGVHPSMFKQMIEYRRQTIPEFKQFEKLFPNYFCDLDYTRTNLIFDPNNRRDNIAYLDPNSPVRWRLYAGLYSRYLFIMEVDMVFARIEPETGNVLSPGSHQQPSFSLWEVNSVSAPFVLLKRRVARSSRTQLSTVTIDQWKQLVDAQRDFSALGIKLKRNDPVPNFEFAFTDNNSHAPGPPKAPNSHLVQQANPDIPMYSGNLSRIL